MKIVFFGDKQSVISSISASMFDVFGIFCKRSNS